MKLYFQDLWEKGGVQIVYTCYTVSSTIFVDVCFAKQNRFVFRENCFVLRENCKAAPVSLVIWALGSCPLNYVVVHC